MGMPNEWSTAMVCFPVKKWVSVLCQVGFTRSNISIFIEIVLFSAVVLVLGLPEPAVALSSDGGRQERSSLVLTNRAGQAVAVADVTLTNQTVRLVLPSGQVKSVPLRIFPEGEQRRIECAAGVAAVPGSLMPVWRLFEEQLAVSRDAAGTRAALGFLVKQLKRLEREQALDAGDATYWTDRAIKRERTVRLSLSERGGLP